MTVTPSNITIADLCQQYQDGLINVDRSYQRSISWPPAARSFLIDTILMGYPLPKLSLAQTTDLRTRRTIKNIVDGQQRTSAIVSFYKNELRISTRSSAYLGLTYNQLEDEDKQRFLSYAVSVDIFTGASDDDIREVFRRMNWYTAPLNSQEKRHAKYAGEFKQFISTMAHTYGPILLNAGTLGKQQVSRMADSAFFSECAYTYLKGIDHASDVKLEKLYDDMDSDFPQEGVTRGAFDAAFQRVSQFVEIYDSNISKSYNMYSLVTALMYIVGAPIGENEFPRHPLLGNEAIVENLVRLDDGFRAETARPELEPFVVACSKATNRKEPRRVRFQYFLVALTSGDFTTLYRSMQGNAH